MDWAEKAATVWVFQVFRAASAAWAATEVAVEVLAAGHTSRLEAPHPPRMQAAAVAGADSKAAQVHLKRMAVLV
jgi:hypothetical protein